MCFNIPKSLESKEVILFHASLPKENYLDPLQFSKGSMMGRGFFLLSLSLSHIVFSTILLPLNHHWDSSITNPSFKFMFQSLLFLLTQKNLSFMEERANDNVKEKRGRKRIHSLTQHESLKLSLHSKHHHYLKCSLFAFAGKHKRVSLLFSWMEIN